MSSICLDLQDPPIEFGCRGCGLVMAAEDTQFFLAWPLCKECGEAWMMDCKTNGYNDMAHGSDRMHVWFQFLHNRQDGKERIQ